MQETPHHSKQTVAFRVFQAVSRECWGQQRRDHSRGRTLEWLHRRGLSRVGLGDPVGTAMPRPRHCCPNSSLLLYSTSGPTKQLFQGPLGPCPWSQGCDGREQRQGPIPTMRGKWTTREETNTRMVTYVTTALKAAQQGHRTVSARWVCGVVGGGAV